MTCRFETVFDPAQEDLDRILDGLLAHNRTRIGEGLYERIAVFARDDTDTLLGGAYGVINWGWFHLELLWVAEPLRGQGVGTKLLLEIEHLARRAEITNFHVTTGDFHARPFYEKLGYAVFAELPDSPKGHTVFYMKKQEGEGEGG